MSEPALKARPVPVSTIARTSSVPSHHSTARTIAADISAVTALSFAGAIGDFQEHVGRAEIDHEIRSFSR